MAVPKGIAKREEAAASPITMRDSGQAVRATPLPVVAEVRPPFLLAVNPLGWTPVEVDGKALWLPEVREVPVIPGTNGAFVTLRNQDPAESVISMQAYLRTERGLHPLDQALVVPASVLPAGVAPGSWSREIDCRSTRSGAKQVTHITPWHVAQPALPGAPIRFELDIPTWNRFRAWLVSAGHVAADATLEIVQREWLRRAHVHLERVETRAYPSPDVATRRIAARRAAIAMAEAATVPGGA